MKTLTRLAPIALVIAVISYAMPARGSMLFPEAIKNELGLAEVPPPAPGCRICHRNDEGGKDNVTKPFGRAMRDNGAVAASVPAMLGALDAVETAGIDSDFDGVPDIQELRDGTDPNVAPPPPDGGPAPPIEDIPLPQTGCATAAGRSTGKVHVGALLLGLLVLWRRRQARVSLRLEAAHSGADG